MNILPHESYPLSGVHNYMYVTHNSCRYIYCILSCNHARTMNSSVRMCVCLSPGAGGQSTGVTQRPGCTRYCHGHCLLHCKPCPLLCVYPSYFPPPPLCVSLILPAPSFVCIPSYFPPPPLCAFPHTSRPLLCVYSLVLPAPSFCVYSLILPAHRIQPVVGRLHKCLLPQEILNQRLLLSLIPHHPHHHHNRLPHSPPQWRPHPQRRPHPRQTHHHPLRRRTRNVRRVNNER